MVCTRAKAHGLNKQKWKYLKELTHGNKSYKGIKNNKLQKLMMLVIVCRNEESILVFLLYNGYFNGLFRESIFC